MKKVLIETASGRLCDLVLPGAEFPVAQGLQWVDAPDDVAHDTHEFDGAAVVAKPARPIAEVREAKLVQLAQARDAAAQADVTVQGHTFAANEKVRALFEQLGGRLRRGKPTALTAIYEATGTPVSPVTAALIDAIEDAIAAQTEAAWNRYGQLAQQVNAATTVAQVSVITW